METKDFNETITRSTNILQIDAMEKLVPMEDGVELNEGYSYVVNGSIPQLADSLAKLALEMDNDADMGDKGGGAFISLIVEYYNNSSKGGEN